MSQPPAADDDGETLDVRRVLETLDRRGVEYLLVGGMAARFHGATRTTKDVDVVPRSDAENLDRLAAALRDLGAFLRVGGLTEDEIAKISHENAAQLFRHPLPPPGSPHAIGVRK